MRVSFPVKNVALTKNCSISSLRRSGSPLAFFSNSPMPQEETDAAVQAVGAEIVKKLPR